MKEVFPRIFSQSRVHGVEEYPLRLLEALASVGPAPDDEGGTAVLTPGAFNSAYFEHSFLARRMGVPLVEGRDLFVDRDRVYARTTHGPRRIDVLYNNASAPRHAPVESFPLEDWHFTIDSELNSVFYVTRKAWPHLKESRGVVINIASTAGIRGSTPGGLAHAAAKAGVIGMTKHLALEGAPHGIRVLSISPGGIATPAIEEYGRAHPEDLEAAVAKNLIPRLGKPSEVVAMALFLASDDAAYITGENVVIDGGRTTCTHW